MWKIGNVKINNKIVFAPMAGISNEVFRSLVKKYDSNLHGIAGKGKHYEKISEIIKVR